MFTLELKNYNEIKDIKANPEITDMTCSEAFGQQGYNKLFFKAFDEDKFMQKNKL